MNSKVTKLPIGTVIEPVSGAFHGKGTITEYGDKNGSLVYTVKTAEGIYWCYAREARRAN
jgi:hypothetical protein